MTISAPPLRDLVVAIAADVHAIRDHLLPAPMPTRDFAAIGLISQIAAELREAAKALEMSAAQLREDGKGWRAGQAMQAAMRARLAADDLIAGP